MPGIIAPDILAIVVPREENYNSEQSGAKSSMKQSWIESFAFPLPHTLYFVISPDSMIDSPLHAAPLPDSELTANFIWLCRLSLPVRCVRSFSSEKYLEFFANDVTVLREITTPPPPTCTSIVPSNEIRFEASTFCWRKVAMLPISVLGRAKDIYRADRAVRAPMSNLITTASKALWVRIWNLECSSHKAQQPHVCHAAPKPYLHLICAQANSGSHYQPVRRSPS
jgi:hypothetical protein